MPVVSWVTLGVLGYVLASLAVGAYVSRRIRTEDDYLVAGRSLGYVLATFTIFATWFGAETCIGAAGSIYGEGLAGGTADPFGYGVCLLLMGAVFAGVLWRLKLTTLADVFRRRYSAGVERFAVLLMVPSSVLWAAAQIRAFGQVLHVSSGLEVSFTISVAAAVVVIYTMAGGLLADAWTDLIQGIALIVGLGVLWVGVMTSGGFAALAAVEPERLRLFGGGTVPPLATLEAWAIPICGSGLAVELVSRVIAARSVNVARRAALVAGVGYLLVGAIPVTLGLAGPQLVPGLEHPEQLLPRLAETYLTPALFTVFAGALVSAILSTVDSALLCASALLSHNLVVPLVPGLGEAAKVRLARAGVALLGVLAYVLALHAEGVYALVEEASAFSSAGVFVVLLVALFTRWGGTVAAYAGLAAGALAWVAGAYVLELDYPYLVSLGASIGAYSLGALAGPRVRNSGSRVAFVAGVCAFASVVGCGRGAGRPIETSAHPSQAPICASRVAGQEELSGPIVVLGETHGTNEIPETFGRLVCHAAAERRGAVLVGLEIWSSAQAAIDSYLDGDGGAATQRALVEHEFWQREFQDGRSSQAQLALLDELRRQRAAGLDVVVRAIDAADESSASARDARMAATLGDAVESLRPAQTLVLAGDVHSRVLPGYPWDAQADYLSLGALLRAKYGDVVGLRVLSAGGSAWICLSPAAAECGVHPLRAREITGPTPRVELDAAATDTLGWSGTLFLTELSAAPPARLQANGSPAR